jgi:cytochrome c oxidase cbb3-type subunit 4
LYKELLQSIEGIEIFPLISLFIFLALSIGLVIWIVKLDKGYVKEMETLPLDGEKIFENLPEQEKLSVK